MAGAISGATMRQGMALSSSHVNIFAPVCESTSPRVDTPVGTRALEFDPCSAALNTATNRVYVSHCTHSRISIVSE